MGLNLSNKFRQPSLFELLVPVVAMVDDVGDSRVADFVSLVGKRRPSDKHHVQSHDGRLQ